ncbi:hypothetical protein [Arsenicicoccus dermatophilus]|uniref:hypothetical protein n=1 Tax=Arsenicicoccus dermatophilus TaxID=1076331 RepID=UPI0039170488
MGWFGRRTRGDAAERIAAFWQWWSTTAPELERELRWGGNDAYQLLHERISPQIDALDPGLAWDVGPGRVSSHLLTVSAGGDPSLLRVARQWLATAPPADEQWEYADLVQPSSLDLMLSIGAATITLAELRVDTIRLDTGLHVVVQHPVLAPLADHDRLEIACLAVQLAVGEEASALWVRGVDAGGVVTSTARPLADLPAVVGALADELRPGSEMGWTRVEMDTPGGPVKVAFLNSLSPVQAPLLDEHVTVRLPLGDSASDRGPGSATEEALNAMELGLTGAVRNDGLLVSAQTDSSSKTLHYYVDSASSASADLARLATGWPLGPARVHSRRDPAWSDVGVG